MGWIHGGGVGNNTSGPDLLRERLDAEREAAKSAREAEKSAARADGSWWIENPAAASGRLADILRSEGLGRLSDGEYEGMETIEGASLKRLLTWSEDYDIAHGCLPLGNGMFWFARFGTAPFLATNNPEVVAERRAAMAAAVAALAAAQREAEIDRQRRRLAAARETWMNATGRPRDRAFHALRGILDENKRYFPEVKF